MEINEIVKALAALAQASRLEIFRALVVAGTEGTHEAVIEVSDNGRGMSEDFIRTKLFKPFSTTKKGGLGVGLALDTPQAIVRGLLAIVGSRDTLITDYMGLGGIGAALTGLANTGNLDQQAFEGLARQVADTRASLRAAGWLP